MLDKKEKEEPLLTKGIKYTDLDDIDVFGDDTLCLVNLMMMSIKNSPKGDIFKEWTKYTEEEKHNHIYYEILVSFNNEILVTFNIPI